MSAPDITAVLNLSREGLMARASLDSFLAACAHATSAGLSCEQIIVFDTADELTREFVDAFPIAKDNQMHVAVADLGTARNCAAEAATGRWIAYLDGDDLWSTEWLTSAYIAASTDRRINVWHPEFNIYFGDDNRIVRHPDMEEASFEPSVLALTNCWTALCFAPSELLRSVPYRRADPRMHIGFEDWTWNVETAVRGVKHKIVPGTAHAIRVRANSLGQRAILRMSRPQFPVGTMDFFKSYTVSRRP